MRDYWGANTTAKFADAVEALGFEEKEADCAGYLLLPIYPAKFGKNAGVSPRYAAPVRLYLQQCASFSLFIW